MKSVIYKILIIVLLGFTGIYFGKSYISYKNENKRLSYNLSIINNQLDSVVDKNGELHYTISSLNLKSNELKNINSELESELKNMKIKIKNLENASVTKIEYKYFTDTIYSEKIVDNKYITTIDDPYYSASWNSTISNDNLIVTDYQTHFNDTIITATEIKYKGWWFWRKPKEIKFHIKSKNPYSNINQVENILFTK